MKWPTEWKHKEQPTLPVVMSTTISEEAVTYLVCVSFDGPGFEQGENENVVWRREVLFGKDLTHRAGGIAFQEAAHEQGRIAERWRRALTR